MSQPTLTSKRLILRPFSPADAPVVQRLAGDRRIAETTLNIPHPYEDGMAEQWIATHGPAYDAGTQATFAIVLLEPEQLVGAIGLIVNRELHKAELGYWVGHPYWNRGYATEAAIAILDFGFGKLGLNRIGAKHLARNPSSGRVMEKAGMLREGRARQDTMKWGQFEDLVSYGILREDWLRQQGG